MKSPSLPEEGEPEAAERSGGYAVWSAREGRVEVRFVGRGPRADRQATLAAIEPNAPPVSWLEQIHSDQVQPARPGPCGRGDGLVATTPDLTLAVSTADCVPIVVGGRGRVAAIHAGWRGLAAGVIERSVRALGPTEGLVAWIGPAIGPCCYEVGTEVSRQVAAASTEEVIVDGPGAKPHLDLPLAAELGLAAAGVDDARRVGPCTRCHPESLWSYRGHGPDAGRNLAFAWLTG